MNENNQIEMLLSAIWQKCIAVTGNDFYYHPEYEKACFDILRIMETMSYDGKVRNYNKTNPFKEKLKNIQFK